MFEANLVQLFARKLNDLRLVYMVTGSVAGVLYGEPRVTHDVDIVVVLKPGSDVSRVASAFPIEEFYCPPEEIPVVEEWVRELGLTREWERVERDG